jgi:DHA3 family multidrug efflux protein-like MFS transporter
MGILGSVFMLREWWPLYVIGMWIYMALVPPVEAAEQTIIQKVVRYDRQGRVFGVAAAMEAAAAPITAFLIAPIAEFLIIPYMKTSEGQQQWEWLLGEGEARGIALICLFAGIIMVIAATLAFFTKSYRKLTELYANAPAQDPNGEDAEGAGEGGVDAAEGSEASNRATSDSATSDTMTGDSVTAGSVAPDSRRFADAPAPLRGMPPEIPEAPESRR